MPVPDLESVSVVIPTWNREKTLLAAVESALRQTHRVKEVLICDDGSTDGSKQLVEQLNDPRVRWLEGARCGNPAAPRNRGIHASTAQWIAFLDSDDEWYPEKLERQLEALRESRCRASCTNAIRVLPQGDVGRLLTRPQGFIHFADLIPGNPILCSSVVVHREILQRSGGFPVGERSTIEDYALWLRVATFTDFLYLDENLVRYYDDLNNNSMRAHTPRTDLGKKMQVFSLYSSWCAETRQRSVRVLALRARVRLHLVRLASATFARQLRQNRGVGASHR